MRKFLPIPFALSLFLVYTTFELSCSPSQANSSATRPGAAPNPGSSGHAIDNSPKPGLIDIYFVRHAETMANYSGHYNGTTERQFAPSASKSIPAVVKDLHGVKLDFAICSPQWRTMATADPILKDHHLSATLWPELNECCNQIGAARLKPARKSILHVGPIKISPEFASNFKLDPTDSQWIANGNYQDGLAQIKLLVQKFKAQFEGKSVRVLVVGHGYCGGRFLESMMGMAPNGKLIPGNAVVIHIAEQPNHTFHLVSMKGSYWHK